MFGRIIGIVVSFGLLAIAPGCGRESEPVPQAAEPAETNEPGPSPDGPASTAQASAAQTSTGPASIGQALTPEQSVGAVVAEAPGAARLFELVGIDYCCGGEVTLAQAAAKHDLDVQRLISVLGMLGGEQGRKPERTWADAPLNELVQHIVSTHHAYLHRELPRLGEIVATVLRVHGEKHSELAEVSKLYVAMRSEIGPHLEMEEQEVFPAILAISAKTAPRTKRLLKQLRTEHDGVGEALHRIRALTDGFTPPSDACALYTQMLKGLEDLERDLHVHVHLENNVLIPRAEKAVDGA